MQGNCSCLQFSRQCCKTKLLPYHRQEIHRCAPVSRLQQSAACCALPCNFPRLLLRRGLQNLHSGTAWPPLANAVSNTKQVVDHHQNLRGNNRQLRSIPLTDVTGGCVSNLAPGANCGAASFCCPNGAWPANTTSCGSGDGTTDSGGCYPAARVCAACQQVGCETPHCGRCWPPASASVPHSEHRAQGTGHHHAANSRGHSGRGVHCACARAAIEN